MCRTVLTATDWKMGRKGRQVMDRDPCPSEGKGKGRSHRRRASWGVNGESQSLGGLILAAYSGKMRPFCWLEGLWNEQEGCERPGPHLGGMHELACP